MKKSLTENAEAVQKIAMSVIDKFELQLNTPETRAKLKIEITEALAANDFELTDALIIVNSDEIEIVPPPTWELTSPTTSIHDNAALYDGLTQMQLLDELSELQKSFVYTYPSRLAPEVVNRLLASIGHDFLINQDWCGTDLDWCTECTVAGKRFEIWGSGYSGTVCFKHVD